MIKHFSDSAFYITTPISYPNGQPHIGHAYEFITSDVLARFHRLDGREVFFMTGTDEHGQKMFQTALKEGVTPESLALRNSDAFQSAQDLLGISYDRFIRTTDPDHFHAAQALWKRMEDNGDIYLDKYSGWYSIRDEAFYTEDETTIRQDGRRYAVETETEVTWTEEESYFFKLSSYKDKLLSYYEENPNFGTPSYRFNEVIRFVEGGLQDLSISRTGFDWGIPVPGNDQHIMYVWVDALTNYLTGVGFPDINSDKFKKFWPADVHVIGKDISRFHAIYWPAFLLSAGISVPKKIVIHGHIHHNGSKMSKSLGNVVSPEELIQQYGLDQIRYFFVRDIPYGADRLYDESAIVTRINSDLANNLGNLAQRSLSMVAKNLGGIVPVPGVLSESDSRLLDSASLLLRYNRESYERQEFHRALESIWQVLGDCNTYFTEQQPWLLSKNDPSRMNTVLYVTLEVLRRVALLLQPIMPSSASALLSSLGQEPGESRQFAAFDESMSSGVELPTPMPIFPRYEAVNV